MKFHMRTPVIVDDPIHFDAVIMAVHPEASPPDEVQGMVAKCELKSIQIPLSIAKCEHTFVYVSTVCNFSDDAMPYRDMYSKRKEMEDYNHLTKPVLWLGGVFKNHVNRAFGYQCKHVSFFFHSTKIDEVEALCKRVSHIGRLRGFGYGEVARYAISKKNMDWNECLIQKGHAVRNIPSQMIDGVSESLIQPLPPYWNMNGRIPGASPGKSVKLKKEVQCVPA